MVRHPLERIEAAYIEHLCTPGGVTFTSINEAILSQPTIVDSSRYWEVFDAYRRRFEESQIMVLWFEEFVTETARVFQEVCRFLGIDDRVVPRVEDGRIYTHRAAARMAGLGRGHLRLNTIWDPSLRQAVVEQLREDNCRLLQCFGRPLNYWGKDLY